MPVGWSPSRAAAAQGGREVHGRNRTGPEEGEAVFVKCRGEGGRCSDSDAFCVIGSEHALGSQASHRAFQPLRAAGLRTKKKHFQHHPQGLSVSVLIL